MPEAESKKLSERMLSAEKSDRPNRSSPFVRWRSLREPKSLRSPESDGRSQIAAGGSAAQDDLSVKNRREPEIEVGNTRSSDTTKVVGKSAPGPANKLGITQVGKDGVAEDDKSGLTPAKPQAAAPALTSSSRSQLLNKKIAAAEESEPAGRAGSGTPQFTASATTTGRNTVTKPLPGSATVAEAAGSEAEISRSAYGRRSLRILFSRPTSSKQKTIVQQQQQNEQHHQTSLTVDTATATVAGSAPSPASPSELNLPSAVGFSPGSSGEKPSRLAAYKRSSAHKLPAREVKGSANRESLPPTATAADPSAGSQLVKLRNGGIATSLKGSQRDGAARPTSVNENQLRAAQRPSLRLSPVCVPAASDDWHSGVSLSSLSSSESSIANQHEPQQQPARAQTGSSSSREAADYHQLDALAASKQASEEPAGKLHLLQSAVTAKKTAASEKSAANGHADLLTPIADDASATDEHAAETSVKVSDAGSVLKFLSEHSKVLNSLAPATRAGCTEADIVLQLTEEVKLLKTGLIHCEAVLREEEATRHKLEQEVLERDSMIKALQKQLSLCRCGAENSHSLRNVWTDGLLDNERSPKDLT